MEKITNAQIQKKKAYIAEQVANNSGNYSVLFIRTYYYILMQCRKRGSNWCYGKEVSDYKVAIFAYKPIRDGRVDHMGGNIINKIKKELADMGYISFKKEDDEWKIYLSADFDILQYDIDEYIKNQDNKKEEIANDDAETIFNYLSENGIKIFCYDKICWRCKKLTKIYTYFLDLQIYYEVGKKYKLIDPKLNMPKSRNQLESIYGIDIFSEIGIGVDIKIDRYLSEKIKNIKLAYSRTMNTEYYMNTCDSCNAIQGMNFVVYNPEEIMNMPYNELMNKVAFKIYPKDFGFEKSDIIRYLSCK